jgi:hypothetical protein
MKMLFHQIMHAACEPLFGSMAEEPSSAATAPEMTADTKADNALVQIIHDTPGEASGDEASHTDQLVAKLQELHEHGVLTTEEFTAKEAELRGARDILKNGGAVSDKVKLVESVNPVAVELNDPNSLANYAVERLASPEHIAAKAISQAKAISHSFRFGSGVA